MKKYILILSIAIFVSANQYEGPFMSCDGGIKLMPLEMSNNIANGKLLFSDDYFYYHWIYDPNKSIIDYLWNLFCK
jgi:hypothetical protein